jgi:hypothetical protein
VARPPERVERRRLSPGPGASWVGSPLQSHLFPRHAGEAFAKGDKVTSHLHKGLPR